MDATRLAAFVGNPDAYAVQLEDGGYKPVREPLTPKLLKKHLAGDVTLGTYVNVGDQAKFVVFDVDTGDDASAQALRVRNACLEMGVKDYAVGIEFSGRKGYHVWVPVGRFVDAHDLRRFGRGVLAMAEVECEVFPKQDVVKDLGNLVKLPGGMHRVSGMASEWQTPAPFAMPGQLWETRVVPNLPPELSGRRFTSGNPERFPCMEAIQAEGASEGSRNNQLFHLATMLRRAGVSQEYVARIVTEVNEKGDPLDPFELTTLLQSAESSGPVCDQLPENRKCGDLCIRARTAGLYTRPRQLRHAQVGENVVVTLAERHGNTVVFEHDDLQTSKGVLT
jgi:hypothetical protein